MKVIGILFGVENSFPSALVEHINARNLEGIRAEFVRTGAVQLDTPYPYALIIDRISHEVPFYRAFLKNAALNGTIVLNDPFWWSADDKLFNYGLAQRLGVAVPPTVMLPHKQLPNGSTERSMRNLEYPLNWDAVFGHVGEHGFLKPIDGGGWRDVHEVHTRDEFFRAYDASRDSCMLYQKAIDYDEYYRCYVIGQKEVHIMPYDPRRPHEQRYLQDRPAASKKLRKRIEHDALKICRALGYEMNTVEFAVQDDVPYAIDFLNPVPDADIHSVGPANFEWIVRAIADLVISRVRKAPHPPALLSSMLAGATNASKGSVRKKVPAQRKAVGTRKEKPAAGQDTTLDPST